MRRILRQVDFKDGGDRQGCFYFSPTGLKTTTNPQVRTGFAWAGSVF